MNKFAEYNEHILSEMLTHPVLFCNPHLKHIAIIGCTQDILVEIRKHKIYSKIHVIAEKNLKNDDSIIKYSDVDQWLNKSASYDLIIVNKHQLTQDQLSKIYNVLNEKGTLVYHRDEINTISQLSNDFLLAKQMGFYDLHLLSFPQFSAEHTVSFAIVAVKNALLPKVKEKNIFNKHFATVYYNFDIHRAAFVLPEFLRIKLDDTFTHTVGA